MAKPPTTSIELAGADRVRQAIFRAQMLYFMHPGATLQAVWDHGLMGDDDEADPIRTCVSIDYLRRMASPKFGNWRSRRDTFWLGVERRAFTALQGRAVEREMEELAGLEGVRTRLMQHIVGDADGKVTAAKPRSLEGLVAALLRLDKRTGDKRDRITTAAAAAAANSPQEVDPGMPTAGGARRGTGPVYEDGLSQDEILAMSRAVAKSRAALEDGGVEDDDD